MAYDNEMIIDDIFHIDNLKEMASFLESKTGIKDIPIDSVVEFISGEKNTKFYLNDKLEQVGQDGDYSDVVYVWLDTGLLNRTGCPLFISMIPIKTMSGEYRGHFIGDSKFLSSKAIEYFPKNRKDIENNELIFRRIYRDLMDERNQKNINDVIRVIIEEKKSEYEKRVGFNGSKTRELTINERRKGYLNGTVLKLTGEVRDLLMFDNWSSPNGLNRYLKVIGSRLVQLIAGGKTEYYQNNGLSAVVNTGLINRFGNDIYILYSKHLGYDLYTADKILDGSRDYKSAGFDGFKELKPIAFFNENVEKFDATLEDIDVTSKALQHIIEARKSRFPDAFQDVTDAQMASRINAALELGVRMQKRYSRFAKPLYSTEIGRISWCLPLHISSDFAGEPELVLVLLKNKDGYFEIKTVLPYDDEVKDKLRCLTLYEGLW